MIPRKPLISYGWFGRSLAMTVVGLLILIGAWVEPRVGLGQEATEVKPSDLLHSAPFDRITLTDGVVLLVDPVSPRPLPAYDPAKEAKSKEPFSPPREGNIFLPGERAKLGLPEKEEKEKPGAREVVLHLLKGEARDYKVKRPFVKRIEYFEDMLLAEGERWRLAHDYARAFECYLRVQTREPRWPGLEDHVDRLLFEEGSAALLDGDGERGLRLLREVYARRPDYPGLADKLALSYGARIAHAFDLGLYPKGRSILHELEQLAPDHAVVREGRERFIAKARKLAEDASAQAGAARLDLLTEALRVWPTLEGAGAKFAEAFAAEPTVDVGVTDLPQVGPWVRCRADARVSRLLYVPVLARDDDESAEGKAAGQLAGAMETSDLGRRLILPLRPGVTWSDGSRPVSAMDVARAFIDRAEPSSPQYNARWADLLDRVEAPEENRVEVRLTRIPLRPASWLVGPVGPAHAGWDGRVVTADRGRVLVNDGLFRWDGGYANEVRFRISGKTKVRRVRERRLADAKATVGALLRGEVSLVEHVPPDHLAALSKNPEIKIGRFDKPSLHRIALDGRNPVLRNRTLRRGLSYAIDRRTLLEDRLLKHPVDAVSLASDGPFAKGSPSDALGVTPLGYDPLLARMLIAAAKKEMGLGAAPIKLTLEYPAAPEPQAVVPKLVEAFGLVGVQVVATERPESTLESELRGGRRFDMAYRISRCDEAVLEAGPLLCPGYDAPPSTDPLASVASPRILQLLLELERAPEWPSAKGIAVQIDRECRDELPILPLWQLEDHYAWRTRLTGPAEVAETIYQGIESWEIAPWYAKDPW